jgi:hypothetical protein
MLTSYDEFCHKQQQVMSDFSRGFNNRAKYRIISNTVELHSPNPRETLAKRGAKERPEVAAEDNNKEGDMYRFKSDIGKMLMEMMG